jgi:hypothetical protein
MTQLYAPDQAPTFSDVELKQLVDYVSREYDKLANVLDHNTVINFEEQFTDLPKPQEGDLLYADGVSWNPGDGQGFYMYINSAWVRVNNLDNGGTITGNLTVTGNLILGTAPWTITPSANSLDFQDSASGGISFNIRNTDPGASGVTLNLTHDSASPAASDIPSLIQAVGRDSAANAQVYGQIYWQITDTTNGSEDATWVVNTEAAGGLIAMSLNATSLIVPRPIDITNASAGSIIFPASQVASANANALDDYEEGTWTPTISYTTPGNLVVAYSAQVGEYVKIGNFVHATFQVVTSTFTHTTASGSFFIAGLPFTPSAYFEVGNIEFSGMTQPAGTSYTTIRVQASSTAMVLIGSPGASIYSTGQHVSGTNVAIVGTVVYEV